MVSRTHLEDVVTEGLAADIFRAERAYYVLKTIGEHASSLNSNHQGTFGELFGALQIALQTEAVLSVSRLYDRQSKRYQTRSIPGLLDYIESNLDDLPDIGQPYQLQIQLRSHGYPESLVDVGILGSKVFGRELISFLRRRLLDTDILTTVEELKSLRDKA